MKMLSIPESLLRQLFVDLSSARSFYEAMSVVEACRLETLGPGHLTVNVNITPRSRDDEDIVLQRLWSAIPSNDPVAGRKIKGPTAWTKQVLRRAEVFVGEGDAAIASAFDDHQRLRAIDLHAVINVPVVDEGRCVATFNVLTQESTITEEERLVVQLLALVARSWILPEKDRVLRELEVASVSAPRSRDGHSA